jgi:hypothetical protein
MKLDANLPRFVWVEDYDEFDWVQTHMQLLLNRKIKVENIGFCSKEYMYVGIAYIGRRPSKASIRKMLEKHKIKPDD